MDSRVTSKDGTSIAYERAGDGPAIVLVGGGLDNGSENAPLVPALAAQFTVYNYARRGRGDSGDTSPYTVEREIEDIDALVKEAGGSASLFGASSGGALVLEAAAAGLAVERLAVYEVPYGWPPPGFAEQVAEMVADGRRGDAVALFMRSAGSSEEDVAGVKNSPYWSWMEAVAHTLAYDAACMRGERAPVGRLATISQPVLVAIGGLSPQSRAGTGGLAPDFFTQAAEAIAAAIPHAERVSIDGVGHMVEADAVAPVLERFFRQEAG